MGYVKEYRNGFFSKSMIENADISKDFQMIGARVGLTALRVLNNKSYQSSQRFYHFVKYGTLEEACQRPGLIESDTAEFYV